jgi:N-methylhydantoinase A
MENRAATDLDSPVIDRRADLRYRGQSFELGVEAGDLGSLEEGFHAAYERRYGYRMEEPVELVNLRLAATIPVEKPELAEGESTRDPQTELRSASFDGEWMDTPVLDRDRMGRSSTVEGPAIVEFAEATCVIRPGWDGEIDGAGNLVLRHE